MKQSTLFGRPLVEDASGGAGGKGKKKPTGKEKAKTDPKKKSKSPLPDTAGGGAAKRQGSETLATEGQNAQMEDDSQATLNFDSQVQEVESQLEETQLDGSSPPVEDEVETQPATQSQTEGGEAQLESQVDEDDGEPVRLFGWAAPCSHTKWISIRSSNGQLHRHERQHQIRSTSGEAGRGLLALYFSSTNFYRLDLYRYVRNITTSNRLEPSCVKLTHPHTIGMPAWDGRQQGSVQSGPGRLSRE